MFDTIFIIFLGGWGKEKSVHTVFLPMTRSWVLIVKGTIVPYLLVCVVVERIISVQSILLFFPPTLFKNTPAYMGIRHFVQGTLTFFFRVCIVYIFKNIRFDVLQISCARKPYLFLKFGGSFFFGEPHNIVNFN